MYITLSEARRHLNIDDFFHEDDTYITDLIKVAEDATEKRLNRPLPSLVDSRTGELSASVRQAILLLIGSLYNQREATSEKPVKEAELSFSFLTALDRKYVIE